MAKGEAAMWKWLTNDGMSGLVGIKSLMEILIHEGLD